MARHEEDREDLMKDARALKRRVAFRNNLEDMSATFAVVVAGIRESGFLSVYFDLNAVFHFDDHNRLRRAFVDNFLYRSQGTTLARMKRERTEEKTVLERHDLDAAELKEFQSRTVDIIKSFLDFLHENLIEVETIIPVDDDSLVPEIVARLEDVNRQQCALSPPLPTKPN